MNACLCVFVCIKRLCGPKIHWANWFQFVKIVNNRFCIYSEIDWVYSNKKMNDTQVTEEKRYRPNRRGLNALLLFLQVFEQTNTRHNFQINYTMMNQIFTFAILSVNSKQQRTTNTQLTHSLWSLCFNSQNDLMCDLMICIHSLMYTEHAWGLEINSMPFEWKGAPTFMFKNR